MVNLLSWWYTGGWATFAASLKNRLSASLDYFSISSLLRTLFQPFRQIDAGGRGLQALVGRLFSRLIGAVVRLIILLVGLVVLLCEIVIGAALLVLWPLIPVLPVVGIVLTAMQVVV